MTSLIHPEKSWPIVLKETVPSSDAETNTLIARFRFPEAPAQALVDGTPVQLRLLLGETKGVLIPLEAVQGSASIGRFVAVVENSQITRREVIPLMKNEAHVLVSERDFRPGEQVVLEGGEQLSTGQQVEVMP
jgi:multidrug efflux pump subunit AcrA (membrane-fusion protein)